MSHASDTGQRPPIKKAASSHVAAARTTNISDATLERLLDDVRSMVGEYLNFTVQDEMQKIADKRLSAGFPDTIKIMVNIAAGGKGGYVLTLTDHDDLVDSYMDIVDATSLFTHERREAEWIDASVSPPKHTMVPQHIYRSNNITDFIRGINSMFPDPSCHLSAANYTGMMLIN